jgi:hypothetical protein
VSGLSILAEVRHEAYRDGWNQASMIAHDDAFERGRQLAEQDAPKRLRWFLFGLLVASLIGALFT